MRSWLHELLGRLGRGAREKGANCYSGRCFVCGKWGSFSHLGGSIRESFRCKTCGASLRYRELARVIVDHYSRENSECLKDLCSETQFGELSIYEPGLIGPLRRLLAKVRGFHQSVYVDDVERGASTGDARRQDLMALTFPSESFDLVITSDILEHVRRPFQAFREIDRVLKPEGMHVFSIPVQRPIPEGTVTRVNTSGSEDVAILPRRYHSAPKGGRALVYTDFGRDMRGLMARDGIELRMEGPGKEPCPPIVRERMLSFYWKKPLVPAGSRAIEAGEGVGVLSELPCTVCGRHRFVWRPHWSKGRKGGVPCCRHCGARGDTSGCNEDFEVGSV